MECEYCGNIFSNKYNLLKHQKNTKKCIELQTKDESYVICKGCNKEFKTQLSLKKHQQNNCKNTTVNSLEEFYKTALKEKDNRIKYLESQNQELLDQLANITTIAAKKETRVTNNVRINQKILNQLSPFNLSKEGIAEIVDKNFTLAYLAMKEPGLAEFAKDHILTDENGKMQMVCSDPSRNLFLYKNFDDELFKDPGASHFTKLYIPPLEKRSNHLLQAEFDKEDSDKNYLFELASILIRLRDEKSLSKLSKSLAKKLVPKPT